MYVPPSGEDLLAPLTSKPAAAKDDAKTSTTTAPPLFLPVRGGRSKWPAALLRLVKQWRPPRLRLVVGDDGPFPPAEGEEAAPESWWHDTKECVPLPPPPPRSFLRHVRALKLANVVLSGADEWDAWARALQVRGA